MFSRNFTWRLSVSASVSSKSDVISLVRASVVITSVAMVCKEDLCCWFKNLNPRKRIEYMCGLLHMCLPLELRFVGTVLEDYGKKDYHYLRNAEVAANKQTEISKYKSISSPKTLRAKVFITLALMRSSSTACAQIIFDIIESKLDSVFSFGPGDDSGVADEVLTVLTLAINHPAFMFEQRRRLHEHLCFLDNQKRDVFRDKMDEDEVPLDLYTENHIPHYPGEEPHMAMHPATLCNRHSPILQPRKVFVQNIEVYAPMKAADKKVGLEYRIVATWSNGEMTEVGKRFREIQEFHRQLMELYPNEKPPNGRIPVLAGSPHQHASREEHISEQIRTLNTYFKSLTGVPSHILECEHFCHFFRGSAIHLAQQPLPLMPPAMPYSQPIGSIPDEEETVNAVPTHLKSMTVRNSHLYYLTPHLNDAASRLPRFVPPPHFYTIPSMHQRFPASHTCQQLLMPAHHIPPQQQQHQQPSPVSPPRSELSSTTTSPTGSRSTSPDLSTTSVMQLLKLLSLEKYSNALGGLSFEQLSSLGSEELSKLGLPRDAQHILRSKLDQINSERPVLINGLIDNTAYPSLSLNSPSSPSSMQWLPAVSYAPYRTNLLTSPRSGLSLGDSSSGALSDVASGGSPPISPGPLKMPGGIVGKGVPGDSSEGSEDMDREKSESLSDTGKSMGHQQGKSAQVKVSPGSGGGGGSSSPHPPTINSRMTPPDEASAKATVVPMQQAMPPSMMPYYHFQPSPLQAPAAAPPGLLGQYGDPKADGMMGVVHNASNNTNNNYTTESAPVVSTGIPQRPALLQAGPSSVRAPFKAGQTQPAHTNISVLQGKSLITMPADPKPGSPVVPMPYVGLRPSDIQTPMGQGMVTSAANPQLEAGAPQRMPLYMAYGRGHAAAPHLTPVHQTQPGVIPVPLVTRSVQTTLPGSASVMTMSASHPVTVVTATHSTAATATSIHRSPSHNNGSNNGNVQRDSGNESISGGSSVMSDPSLRSSPLQVGGGAVTVTQVAAAPSPPVSHHAGCQVCAQGTPYTHAQVGAPVMYPYPIFMHQGPNGLIPQAAMPNYFGSQPLATSMMTNGYSADMYSTYSHQGYPTLNPASGLVYPMMHGNTLYAGAPSQPSVPAAAGNGAPAVPPQPQPPAAVGGGLVASGQQASSVTIKQRNTGCYNCGSSAHKAADCTESSMEMMSGRAVYSLDYKPHEESD